MNADKNPSLHYCFRTGCHGTGNGYHCQPPTSAQPALPSLCPKQAADTGVKSTGCSHHSATPTKEGGVHGVAPFVTSSASNRKRLTFGLKFQCQNTEVQLVLILCSVCSSQLTAKSQGLSTYHWVFLWLELPWNINWPWSDLHIKAVSLPLDKVH